MPEGLSISIPPRVNHHVLYLGAVAARILFVDEVQARRLPAGIETVNPSAFMWAPPEKIVADGNDCAGNSLEVWLSLIMLDELAQMSFDGSSLPVSAEPGVARVLQRLVKDPLAEAHGRRLASVAGATARTLARPPRSETGMMRGQWRTNLRLQKTIRRLTQGATVTDVAFDMGYNSTSAFIHMFRTNLGAPLRRCLEAPECA